MIRKIPKGKLVLIGGAEDKDKGEVEIADKTDDFKPLEILSALLPRKKRLPSIEVITTASRDPDSISRTYTDAFTKVGFRKIDFINMGNDPGPENPRFIERLKKTDAVFFSGGDQFRLSVVLGNSDVIDTIRERYQNDAHFTVAGTSAGAMALPALMMFEGENNEALLKGTVKVSSGLGFLDTCLIDTHFAKRGRFGRLAQAVVVNPSCVGIGIGEDTALIITKGREARCIGSGMCIVIDGKRIRHTNMAYARDHEPVCIEGLQVHILCRDTGFNLERRKFIPSRKDMREEAILQAKT